MNDKQFKKLVRDSQEATVQEPLTEFLKKTFPKMTIKQGCAVWWLLMNRRLIVDEKDISGSFRYNGSCISHAVGKKTNYLHFYCSYLRSGKGEYYFTESFALKQMKIIEKADGKIKNTVYETPLQCYKKHKILIDKIIIIYWYFVIKSYNKYRVWKFNEIAKKYDK